MYKKYDYQNFIDDSEKMFDFISLDRERFLQSYSYLSSLEYDLTFDKFYSNVELNFINLCKEYCKTQNTLYKRVLKQFYKNLQKNKQENIQKELTKNNLCCNIFM